jgi:hypothetical protein
MKNVVWFVAATENNLLTTGAVDLPFFDCHNGPMTSWPDHLSSGNHKNDSSAIL